MVDYESLFIKEVKEDDLSHGMNDDQSHKYRWISFMDRLSNGDITKHDEIYRRNYLETLNLLSWWKIRDQAQEMMNKMNRNKYV